MKMILVSLFYTTDCLCFCLSNLRDQLDISLSLGVNDTLWCTATKYGVKISVRKYGHVLYAFLCGLKNSKFSNFGILLRVGDGDTQWRVSMARLSSDHPMMALRARCATGDGGLMPSHVIVGRGGAPALNLPVEDQLINEIGPW